MALEAIDGLYAVIGTAIGGAGGYFGKALIELIKGKNATDLAKVKVDQEIEKRKMNQMSKAALYLEGLSSVFKVHCFMEAIETNTPATRVFLLKLGNGGATPKPGSSMWAKGVYAKCEESLAAQKLVEQYNKVRVDDHYVKMAMDAVLNPAVPVILEVANMPDCVLKNFYLSEGVTYSLVYWIYTDGEDDQMYLMSIATKDPNERFTKPKHRVAISLNVQHIMAEFDKYGTAKHLE